MAITQRKGAFKDFDPSKMLPGELAVVRSGDPASPTGRTLYVCFEPGIVKRIVSYEDFENEFRAASDEIRAQFQANIQAAISAANNAASAASVSKQAADQAAARANEAAAACEGLTDNQRVTALEQQMAQVIAALANTLATE